MYRAKRRLASPARNASPLPVSLAVLRLAGVDDAHGDVRLNATKCEHASRFRRVVDGSVPGGEGDDSLERKGIL
jgi:hypothetical protein